MQTKKFTIPSIVMERICLLDKETAGEVLTAVFAYSQTGATPENLTQAALVIFLFAKDQIDPILKRQRSAAMRAAEKAGKTENNSQSQAPESTMPGPESKAAAKETFNVVLPSQMPAEHQMILEEIVADAIQNYDKPDMRIKFLMDEMQKKIPGIYHSIEAFSNGTFYALRQ